MEPYRYLVAGQTVAAEASEVLRVQFLFPAWHDPRDRSAPVLWVRSSGDAGIEDVRMFQENGFDLSRVDVFPARNQEVGSAVEDPEFSPGVERANVSRVKPAVDEGLGRCFRERVSVQSNAFRMVPNGLVPGKDRNGLARFGQYSERIERV